ncbi:uncharacterized protein CLUP02_07218 [Colletotrichum lupini]|uniref:Uncharacterized protein n=1 Tax=Colletotrichum lupini TaxID=145971 RepID=A0A9Q8SQK7_9PEZI|nr:uncharacterized protein CLUP02_07218 [Colletotrichum lupini]UQC81732.1 hypothetical protein CLUP02_07218 [Colletotrichum lupini]
MESVLGLDKSKPCGLSGRDDAAINLLGSYDDDRTSSSLMRSLARDSKVIIQDALTQSLLEVCFTEAEVPAALGVASVLGVHPWASLSGKDNKGSIVVPTYGYLALKHSTMYVNVALFSRVARTLPSPTSGALHLGSAYSRSEKCWVTGGWLVDSIHTAMETGRLETGCRRSRKQTFQAIPLSLEKRKRRLGVRGYLLISLMNCSKAIGRLAVTPEADLTVPLIVCIYATELCKFNQDLGDPDSLVFAFALRGHCRKASSNFMQLYPTVITGHAHHALARWATAATSADPEINSLGMWLRLAPTQRDQSPSMVDRAVNQGGDPWEKPGCPKKQGPRSQGRNGDGSRKATGAIERFPQCGLECVFVRDTESLRETVMGNDRASEKATYLWQAFRAVAPIPSFLPTILRSVGRKRNKPAIQTFLHLINIDSPTYTYRLDDSISWLHLHRQVPITTKSAIRTSLPTSSSGTVSVLSPTRQHARATTPGYLLDSARHQPRSPNSSIISTYTAPIALRTARLGLTTINSSHFLIRSQEPRERRTAPSDLPAGKNISNPHPANWLPAVSGDIPPPDSE